MCKIFGFECGESAKVFPISLDYPNSLSANKICHLHLITIIPFSLKEKPIFLSITKDTLGLMAECSCQLSANASLAGGQKSSQIIELFED